MTSFVNLKYARLHLGASRSESALDVARQLDQGLPGTRGLAMLLLSAMVAAAVIVAYQVMDSVTEGHLLVMWLALWMVAFAVFVFFSGAARKMAMRLKAGVERLSRNLVEVYADEQLWELAKTDYRLALDRKMAKLREQARAEAPPAAQAAPVVQAARAEPVDCLVNTRFCLYPYI